MRSTELDTKTIDEAKIVLYVVEVISLKRILTRAVRTTDYDLALVVFDMRKKTKVREVRMVKLEGGRRKTLKYLDRARSR